jgi:glycerophosphoryl diester phosphodiesterase
LIHQLGKKAWVYTIDDLDKARLFITGGIDGIITNVPADVVQLRSQWSPARSRSSSVGGK